MRLILNAQTAGEVAQPIWVSSGQSLTVGRTEEAQFVIAADLVMSRIHFEVSIEGEECRISDRGSSNGTFLNRERIREALLKDGDQIQAGHTQFQVRLEPTATAPSSPKSAPPAESPRPSFIRKECSSGAVLMQLKKRLPQPVAVPIESPTKVNSVVSSGASPEVKFDERRTMDMFLGGFATPVEEFPRPARGTAPVKPEAVAVLHMVSGSEIGRALRIGLGQSFSAGRLEQNDFAFPNEHSMSGRHFQIEFTGGELVVQDIGSRNGMIVNGIPCKRAILCDADRLMVGDAMFQVRFEAIGSDPGSLKFVETVTEIA